MSVVVRVCQCGLLCSDTLLLQPTVSYDYFRALWEKAAQNEQLGLLFTYENEMFDLEK